MAKIEAYEQDILAAFEKGRLKSVTTKGELEEAEGGGQGDRRQGPQGQYPPVID